MRKLAHVERIISIDNIEGKDFIGLANVLGWHCIVKKSDFKPGDLGVYIETDSILPKIEPFAFMERYKYRVKTIKMGGVYSQGLFMPLSILGNGNWKDGQDVTDVLGITKWENPEERSECQKQPKSKIRKWLWKIKFLRPLLSKKYGVNKQFPSYIIKTDEERIQNIPEVLQKLDKIPTYITEKCDGQSGTFFYRKDGLKTDIGVCSRNLRKARKDNSNWWQVEKKYDILNKLKKYGKNMYIQGEIIGPGIQKNKYGLKEIELRVFTIFNLTENRYYSWGEMESLCKEFGLPLVPLIERNAYLPDMVDKMVELSKGESVLAKIPREGIVVREENVHLHRVSFKVINPEFLIHFGL